MKDFALPDLSGNIRRLSEFKGKVVLLNFWATWCTACLAEVPELIELHALYADRVAVVGIALDGYAHDHEHEHGSGDHDPADDSPDPAAGRKVIQAKVARASQRLGINYPVLLDPEGRVGARFNGHELPTNVLLDEHGQVRRRFIGARPMTAWKAMLDDVLGKRLPPEGPPDASLPVAGARNKPNRHGS